MNTLTVGKNGYIAYYKGKRLELRADTIYQAQCRAAEYFKTKKGWEITLGLAELGSAPVIHTGGEL